MPERTHTDANVFRKIYYAPYIVNNQHNFYNAVKGNKDLIQRMKLLQKLPVHNGCVNTISWNETGEYILSGSDDQHLCITNGYTHKLLTTIQTGHRANIFSAKFLPNTNDEKVVSCSGDGIIMYTNVTRNEDSVGNSFNCHFGTTYKIVTVPNDPHTFLSCGEDGTVRWYDLRIKQSCDLEECREDILINCRRAVTALAVNPLSPYLLAVGCSDSHVQLFDRRMMGTKATGGVPPNSGIPIMRFAAPGFENRSHRITSLTYSSKADEILVSYSSEYLYLFKLRNNEQSERNMLGKECGMMRKKLVPGPLPMKRLRLRGDWSDTGPNARPEREMQETTHRPSLHTSLMQRMSDVLTRMLNDPGRAHTAGDESATPRNPSSSQETVADSTAAALAGERLDSSTSTTFTDSEESCASVLSETNQMFVNNATVTSEEGESTREDASSLVPPEVPTLESTNSVADNPFLVTPSDDKESPQKQSSCDNTHEQQSCCAIPFPTSAPGQTGDGNVISEETQESHLPSGSGDGVASGKKMEPEQMICEPSSSTANLSMPVIEATEENPSPEGSLPGKEVLQNSLQSLERELLSQRKQFLEKHNVEPVVNLHYSAQGVSSGVITMGLNRSEDPIAETSTAIEASALPSSDENATSNNNSSSNNGISTDKGVIAGNETTNLAESPGTMHVSGSKGTSAQQAKPKNIMSGPNLKTSGNAEMIETSRAEGNLIADPEHADRDNLSSNVSSVEAFTDSSASFVASQQVESENSSRSGIVSTQTSDYSMFPGSSSESSSGDEEMTRCWFQRQADPSPSRLDLSDGELVRNIEEAKAGSTIDESESDESKNYTYYAPPQLLHVFTGHRNARTMIKEANFWGEDYIMSGSDCGHIFFWDRYTAKVVMILEADRHVVNCIQPHPYDPVLASSGIDYDIKLWAPLQEEPNFDEKMASEIMRRNEIMLEETRDTITVPASFMIRMLASLNHLRAGNRLRSSRSQPSMDNN